MKSNRRNVIDISKKLFPFRLVEVKLSPYIFLRRSISGLTYYESRRISETLEKEKDNDDHADHYERAIHYLFDEIR
jgi:hypothetical protein